MLPSLIAATMITDTSIYIYQRAGNVVHVVATLWCQMRVPLLLRVGQRPVGEFFQDRPACC